MKRWMSVMVFLGLLTGCVSDPGKLTASSSLVDFLYPNKSDYEEHKPETPTLTLPVRVGIAFVPPSEHNYSSISLSEKRKHEILSEVKEAFITLDYVSRIEIISDNYLKAGGGFDTLEQLSRLYHVDVIALVSYDQVARSNENNASLLYWTIAGMYLIPGNSNTTQTFVDTALFDIDSRKMLFRAPGISKVDSLSTAIGIDASLQEDTTEGFDLAVDDMITNLNTELDMFKDRVRTEQIAKIETRSGYSGGGVSVGVLIAMMGLMISRRHRKLGEKR